MSSRSRSQVRNGIAAIALAVAGVFALGGGFVHVSAATVSLWLQSLDSCKQGVGSGQYQIVNSSDTVNQIVTTPASSVNTVGSGSCPLERGNCVTNSTQGLGCVAFSGLTFPDTYQIHMTVTPSATAKGASPLGYSACAGGSACRSEIVNVTVDGNGNISATTTSTFPDGFVATFPNSGTYSGTATDPVLFHTFGLGYGNCDGDSDADDQLTGTPSSHCGYPEADESSACQPYPWSCTLAVIPACSPSCSAGPATHFALSSPGPLTAGAAFQETITAEDGHNLTATSYAGTQTLTWSGPSKSPNGTVPKYPANPVTFTDGVAQVTVTLTDAQTTSLSVIQGSLFGTVTGLTVAPTTASQFGLSNPGTATAGQAFTETVTAKDRYGNTAVSYSGSPTAWSGPSRSPSGVPPAYPSTLTLTNGVGTAPITLFDAQSTALVLSDGTIKGKSTRFMVNPAPASAFSLSNPATQTAGVAFTETITAIDQYGNIAVTYPSSACLTFSGPSTSPNGSAPSYPSSGSCAAGQSNVTFSSGIGFASITLFAAQTAALSVADGSNTSGASAPFSVNPGATTTLSVALPATSPSGQPDTATVTALDVGGNTVTLDSSTLSVTSSDPAATANNSYPTNTTLSSGQSTFGVTFYTAGSQSVTVSGEGLQGQGFTTVQ